MPLDKASIVSLNDGNSNSGRGFSLITASVFIIGEVAGGGILSLPYAISQASWGGLAMIAYCCFCAGLSGLYLSKCWLILEERYPKYRGTLTRKPFATIGYHAYGKVMSAIVSILMNVTRIGAGTVFLLLSSGLFHSVSHSSFLELTLCEWIPITSAILLVPMWLGSPADFWPMAYSAMISTVVGSILLVVRIIMEINDDGLKKVYYVQSFESFAGAFGTILFAFGGASAFPNFQNDMKEKQKFPMAVLIGFIGLILLYIPTAGLGYAVFGKSVRGNIIDNFSGGALVTIIQVCFLIHCLTVVLIVVNPVFLDLEELLQIPKNFNWKRVLFRTGLHIFMLFLGESSPGFGQILDLVGGSTITLMAFVLPPLFYYKLCKDSDKDSSWPERNISIGLIILFVLVAVSGIAGGISSTYSTIKNWKSLTGACYLHNFNTTGL